MGDNNVPGAMKELMTAIATRHIHKNIRLLELFKEATVGEVKKLFYGTEQIAMISDLPEITSEIDDAASGLEKTWSSKKIGDEMSLKAEETEALIKRAKILTETPGNKTFDYDANGNVIKLTHKDSNDVVIYTVDYTYDVNGTVTKAEYIYNGIKLTEEYFYDANGNVTNTIVSESEVAV